jgi:hypothetical protein
VVLEEEEPSVVASLLPMRLLKLVIPFSFTTVVTPSMPTIQIYYRHLLVVPSTCLCLVDREKSEVY